MPTMMPIGHDFFVMWKDDILGVRLLYREHKYRRCAVLCAELLLNAKHPVHRTFLHFYQAVCYESLGHISHNYSSNKIPLFEQARDAFISAGETLPVPFLTSANGEYTSPGLSPFCATSEMLDLYGNYTPSVHLSSSSIKLSAIRRRPTSITTLEATPLVDHASVTYTPRALDGYLARNDFVNDVPDDKEDSFTPQRQAEHNHKARLSRSLSSQHALATSLVPSPLFSREPSSKKESISTTFPTTALPLVMLSKPLPPTPINRPLPALPFNHQPKFILKGKRVFMAPPRRRTALSTLVLKFEGKSPFDSPSPDGNIASSLVLANGTPTTERFKRISAMFSRKQTNETAEPAWQAHQATKIGPQSHTMQLYSHTSDRTPRPFPTTPSPNPAVYTTPAASSISTPRTPTLHTVTSPASRLAAYNDHLSSFRTAILFHISSVSTNISKTHTIQLAHEAEKRTRFATMHARHPSTTPTPSPKTSPSNSSPTSRKKVRASQPLPIKDARLRSFWSLQIAESQETSADEEKLRLKRARIARSKADGWKDVRKEAKGWKGAEYYERLRVSVERELACC